MVKMKLILTTIIWTIVLLASLQQVHSLTRQSTHRSSLSSGRLTALPSSQSHAIILDSDNRVPERFASFSLLPSAADKSVFTCPDKFGYFADKTDCTRYFVCVFGEPLHESCTGGLYFSAELQTCDWPRNVLCPNEKRRSFEKSVFSTVDIGEGDDSYEDYESNEKLNKNSSSKGKNESRKMAESDLRGNNSIVISFDQPRQGNSLESEPIGRSTSSNTGDDRVHYGNPVTKSESPMPLVFYTGNNEKSDHFTRTAAGEEARKAEHKSNEKRQSDLERDKMSLNQHHHGNKINLEYDPQAPNYAEAIPSLYDAKGGIHFSDGIGGTFGLTGQLPGLLTPGTSDHNVNVFAKPIPKDKQSDLNSRLGRHLRESELSKQRRNEASDEMGYDRGSEESEDGFRSKEDSSFEYIPVIRPEKPSTRMAKDLYNYDQNSDPHNGRGYRDRSALRSSSSSSSSSSAELDRDSEMDWELKVYDNVTRVIRRPEDRRESDSYSDRKRLSSDYTAEADDNDEDNVTTPKSSSDEIILIPFTFNDGKRESERESDRVRVIPRIRSKSQSNPIDGELRTGNVQSFPSLGTIPDSVNDSSFHSADNHKDRSRSRSSESIVKYRDNENSSNLRANLASRSQKDEDKDNAGFGYHPLKVESASTNDANNHVSSGKQINSNLVRLIHRNGHPHSSSMIVLKSMNIGDDHSNHNSGHTQRQHQHNHQNHETITSNDLGGSEIRKSPSNIGNREAISGPISTTTMSPLVNSKVPLAGKIIRTLQPRTIYSDPIRIFNGKVVKPNAKPVSLRREENGKPANDRAITTLLTDSLSDDNSNERNSGLWSSLENLHDDMDDIDYLVDGGFSGSINGLVNNQSATRDDSGYLVEATLTTTTESPSFTLPTTGNIITTNAITSTTVRPESPLNHNGNNRPKQTSDQAFSKNRRLRPTNKRIVVKQMTTLAPKLPSRPANLYPTPVALSGASRCDLSKCVLPDCNCASPSVPGNFKPDQIPQIVLLTFDDAVNDLNWEIYEEIFNSGRLNPNGCPILGTFYVSHEWTDYGQVQTLYSRGHEMASHGVTHSFGEKFSKNQWHKEINGQREILHLYGAVKLEDVRGMRAPFLQIGGNKMFEMLYDDNFTYDSSMPVFDNKPPYWPYTLDYSMNHECMISPCPTKSFPGIWEVGMVMWEDSKGGRCSMGDACSNPMDEEGVFEMLMKNFNRHYKTNRAPFGLFYHSAWFNTVHHRRGFMKFLDEILRNKDVFMTTNWQMIQWIRNPTPTSEIDSFEPWKCDNVRAERPAPCNHPNVCNVRYQSGSRFMKTCQPCPSGSYPWVYT